MAEKRKRVIETVEEGTAPGPLETSRADSAPTLEQWLAEMATRPEVAVIRIAKRSPTGRWVWLRPYDLMPPFVADLTEVFQSYGDGLYRFAAVTSDGRYVTSHNEEVSGYGPQRMPWSVRGPVQQQQQEPPPQPDDVDPDAVSLRDLIQMERERLVLESLRRARSEKDPQGSSDLERLASIVSAMATAMASAFQPLATMMASKMDATARLLEAVVPRLTQEPQPVDKLIDAMGKVLELRERMPEDVSGGMGSYLKPILAVLTTQLAQRLAGPVPTAALASGTPPPPPSVPAPAPGASAAVTPAPATGPNGAPVASPPSWLVAAVVDAAERGDTDFELWADVIEHRLPGTTEIWARVPVDQWLAALAQVPDLASPRVQAWLRGLHASLTRAVESDAS
jgi:hypothetical protein